MIRRPPISTRTDTRFPSTTLFRSSLSGSGQGVIGRAPQRPDLYCRSLLPASTIFAGSGRDQRTSGAHLPAPSIPLRSEEHTSELQSLMRISYAVFCLKNKKKNNKRTQHDTTT